MMFNKDVAHILDCSVVLQSRNMNFDFIEVIWFLLLSPDQLQNYTFYPLRTEIIRIFLTPMKENSIEDKSIDRKNKQSCNEK